MMSAFSLTFACYSRVSTDAQDGNTSADTQFSHSRNYGESQGWELAAVNGGLFHDTISGIIPADERDSAKALLREIKNKRINIVIVKRADRLGRDYGVSKRFIELIYGAGGKLAISDKATIYPSLKDCLNALRMEMFFSEYDYSGIVEKNWQGRLEMFLKGSSVLRLPYGYRSERDSTRKDKFRLVKEYLPESEKLRDVLEHFAGAKSIKESLDYARSKGYVTKDGPVFSHYFFHRILKNLAKYNGQEFPQEYEYYGEIHHRVFSYPKIISDQLYNDLLRAIALKDISKKPRERYDSAKAYNGLVFCSHCGSKSNNKYKQGTRTRSDGSRLSFFVIDCSSYRAKSEQSYRETGKKGEHECSKSIVHSKLTEKLLEFLDGAREYGTAESYAREISRVIRSLMDDKERIEWLETERDDLALEKSTIQSNLDKLMTIKGADIQAFVNTYGQSMERISKGIESRNVDIETVKTEYSAKALILESAGLEITDELLDEYMWAKLDTDSEFLDDVHSDLNSLPTEKTREIVERIYSNAFISSTVKGLAKELTESLGRLKELVISENWDRVNTELYRLGIRFYVDFNSHTGDKRKTADIQVTVNLMDIPKVSPIVADLCNSANMGHRTLNPVSHALFQFLIAPNFPSPVCSQSR